MQPKAEVLLLEQLPRARQLLKAIKQRRNRNVIPLNSEIYAWFNGFSLEVILYLMARSENDAMRKWISLYVTTLRNEKSDFTWRRFNCDGFFTGAPIQEISEFILQERLNTGVKSREEEIALVKANFFPPS